jgi:hypothetical protein
MAIRGAIQVEQEGMFGFGLWLVSELTPVKDWDRSTPELEQQKVERDENGDPVLVDGQPLRHWEATVMDGDPSVRQQDKTLKVTFIATHQPVPPAPAEGTPFAQVELTGMTLSRWFNRKTCQPPQKGRPHICGAREVVSLTATGFRTPADAKAKTSATTGNGRSGSG